MLSLTAPSTPQDRTAALIARFEAERSGVCTVPGCRHLHAHTDERAPDERRARRSGRRALAA